MVYLGPYQIIYSGAYELQNVPLTIKNEIKTLKKMS